MCESPWGISLFYMEVSEISQWPKWFCWYKFFSQEAEPENWKVLWRQSWKYLFWVNKYLSWLREFGYLPLFQDCHFSSHSKGNLDHSLLSSLYLVSMAPKHQGVGILHIDLNNKIVSIFIVFLRRSFIKIEWLFHHP